MNYDNKTNKLCDQDQLLQMTHMGSHMAGLGASTQVNRKNFWLGVQGLRLSTHIRKRTMVEGGVRGLCFAQQSGATPTTDKRRSCARHANLTPAHGSRRSRQSHRITF